ncbi:hypothetical protein CQY20_12115 [Mycolicibacterium agri]|uniref:DUF1707 domain-containing protein n=1 Tax=Mycolicibacterium agri TaxID=36811 RepID=A0A2A7N4D0_MYCAG|nr:hypothetical protein CQY20_12115 [Mycolicibacterium agri]GFG53444.1 hypothetical protein MAGR_48850 [Mycolicibacterium agri]
MATRQGPGTRARDADRTAVCQLLDSAFAEGQLSVEEHRQRVSAAVNATTLQELHALVEDLQTAGPQLRAAPRQRFSPRVVPR